MDAEYWRIVHCEDDLSWALFYYAGAASAAGQVYTGAILATPDGAWPAEVRPVPLSVCCHKTLWRSQHDPVQMAFLCMPAGTLGTKVVGICTYEESMILCRRLSPSFGALLSSAPFSTHLNLPPTSLYPGHRG